MPKKFPFLTNYQLVCLLWIAVAAFCWHYKFANNRYNNYQIFKGVYWHAKAQTNLYAQYPAEYYDTNHYGPVFSVLIAPLALLPDGVGFLLFNLINMILLAWAVHLLPLPYNKKVLILLFSSIEYAVSQHAIQFNPIIAAFIIFSFILVEKKRDEWATLFIILGTLVKIYPVAGLAFFMFSKNKPRFILSAMIWAAVFITVPMLISGKSFILQSYADWWHALTEKNALNVSLDSGQDLSVMGVVRRVTQNINVPNLPFLIFGATVFGLSLLRFKQYRALNFRLGILASVLMMVVLFSTGSEHPTYIIAVTGAMIWIFMQDKPFTTGNIVLLVCLLVITGLGPSDAFPKFIRQALISKYALKVWPCALLWLKISYDLLFKEFTNQKPVALKIAHLATEKQGLAYNG
jgi:hypothetical protein